MMNYQALDQHTSHHTCHLCTDIQVVCWLQSVSVCRRDSCCTAGDSQTLPDNPPDALHWDPCWSVSLSLCWTVLILHLASPLLQSVAGPGAGWCQGRGHCRPEGPPLHAPPQDGRPGLRGSWSRSLETETVSQAEAVRQGPSWTVGPARAVVPHIRIECRWLKE